MVATFKLLTPQLRRFPNLSRRGPKLSVHPYLYSHSSKLHNWGPEIGFPNLSLLIQSGQFRLCNSPLSSPPTLRTSWQFTYLPVESEGFFRHPFRFPKSIRRLRLMHDINKKCLKGPSVFALWRKVHTFLRPINGSNDKQGQCLSNTGHKSAYIFAWHA